jgi:hypothetical protein
MFLPIFKYIIKPFQGVPYVGNIDGGFYPGKMVRIQGMVLPSANRYSLLCFTFFYNRLPSSSILNGTSSNIIFYYEMSKSELVEIAKMKKPDPTFRADWLLYDHRHRVVYGKR